MTSNEIRQQFLDFFKGKDHRIVPSAPVVPHGDPTLLFTNAGMNQFKDVFLGTGSRDYKRAADTQKCIRVSGKHNDLEEVGYDTYHHTFFEMLGNWSFGDYYKKEAIAWAWELLTEVWNLPKERLWATVYRTDDEAFNFWKKETDINPNHILRFDEKDNFWEMGETGPCGPCSEIHINLSDDLEAAHLVNAGSPLCIEIWNLVFIQYNRDENGQLHELPAKHVDTGMGFERICAVLQNKKSNYDTDVFTPIINAIEKLSKRNYNNQLLPNDNSIDGKNNVSMRVIADHIRTLTFAIGDGATPGNEGRGYVLRRLLRRASRYGRKLDLKEPFLYKLVDVVVKNFSHVFPEIKTNQSQIEKIIKAEEESFNATLDRGIELFDSLTKKLNAKNEKVISGEDVFKLYDTYGFPVDLTAVMARENGFTIDENRFNELMNEQKDRARKSTKEKIGKVAASISNLDDFNLINNSPTIFTGYDELTTKAKIIGFKKEDSKIFIVLDRTPFYVESGGQISDTGIITIGDKKLSVVELIKINNQVVHVCEINEEIKIENGKEAIAEVDKVRRWNIMRNHSATHFLHKAIRQVLGTHVQQAGSYVGPDRLRFDFNHFEKVSKAELDSIEQIVNEKLRENIPMIHHRDTPFDKAKKMGALMFFGDKYGDKVNVVQFGDFTMEFCGGTHVQNSSQIGLLKIISESSIASGVRRIEAVTGEGVEKYIKEQQLKIDNLELRVNEFIEEKKKLEKELSELKLKEKLGGIDSIISSSIEINGIKIFKGKVEAANMDELKSMGDELREKMKSGVGVLISVIEDKVGIVTVVSDDLIKEKKILAGNIVKQIAQIVGGSGGGRPHLATAGGKDVSKIDEALAHVDNLFNN
ncbi:alanine--tRNA ligase [Stygiobacter electus]|uniref:Alanine--tRNA ligase n=1 Tax=Stygiobacter electus TaxID=3032292 RepID=A0AAE3NZV2_9BACT|nr:alanine--tRNA ligase [Stygiobacter electus]MDF1611660.1 alanine--tRNA ligase [Stygiobacter electus]